MMKARDRIEHTLLLEKYGYDDETGVFWLRRTGRALGKMNVDGYVDVSVAMNGRSVRVKGHSLAWFYVNGSWPNHTIDHRNKCKVDNRLENLLDLPASENNGIRSSLADRPCIRTQRAFDESLFDVLKRILEAKLRHEAQ